MQIDVGTSGYAYKEWKGSFYPADLSATKMLAYYAERLSTVEMNNTFYGLPKPEALDKLVKQVPDSFVFSVKAPQEITHFKRLRDTADIVTKLTAVTTALGAKAGPVLFQLPPNFKKDLPRLDAFVRSLPAGCSAAVEFRHDSWFTDDVYEVLRAVGAVLVTAEDEKLRVPLVATADWGYLRLRREDYTDADVTAWADVIRSQPWQRAFVYFKHEDTGSGPKLAALLRRLLEEKP